MPELSFKQIGPASNLARHLRAVNRVSRTEVDGHTFTYADLKEIWADETENHIVLTQNKDKTWQHWTNTEDRGWFFIGVYPSREDAQQGALAYDNPPPPPGVYLLAQLTENNKVIRVRCESKSGPEIIGGIFERMGYQITTETVAS